ncbi:hemerythrin domain-containing protein [Streptomyces flavidovirens]|uniref:hemerythrin domain-containing protein n=1 Tax=Streptomyces flavidovirens TaxID=67298 RepID=UPI003439D088
MTAQRPAMDKEPEREQAENLPENDVVAVLLRQHAEIRALFGEVRSAEDDQKKDAFDRLRALLAVHETAEEMVVRPVAQDMAGKEETDARNQEEHEANKTLSHLENLDVTSQEFEAKLAQFEQAVLSHAQHEEMEEFPALRKGCTPEQLQKMGKRLAAVEKLAPTHPHPTTAGSPMAQWTVGPFASVLDRARDALSSSRA